MSIGIQTRLTAGIALVASLLVVAVGWTWTVYEERELVQTLQQREARMAGLIERSFAGPIWNLDHVAIENLLDAVIGLPGNLFPTTSIPVAILLLDRAREKGGARADRDDVLFIDASGQYTPAKTKNQMEESHIQRIVATCRARQGVERFASLVSRATLAENDFNLNIPRYVDTYEEEAPIDLKATEAEIERLEEALATVRQKMKQHLRELGL